MRRGDAGTIIEGETQAPVSPPGRQACLHGGCFASFDAGFANPDEIRHCNRGGPDGGHPHRWDLTSWQIVGSAMQHDRS